MRQGERVEVALAFCDKSGVYARHAAAVMASIFANTESNVCVHLLHDDTLTSENRAKLRGTADAFNQEIGFINVEGRTSECVLGNKQHAFPGAKGMYYRFLIPSAFDFDKIIYLDCDIIVNLDIAELWHADLGGRAIGVVPECGEDSYSPGLKRWVRWRLVYRAMGMNFKDYRYFNSGVIVIDLKKIRKNYDFLKEVRDFYSKFRHMTQLADQDCFNSIFLRDCQYIDSRFNRTVADSVEIDDIRSIWHLISADKPWCAYAHPGIDELYWKYLSMTPFCRDKDELITMILSGMWQSKYCHPRTSNCKKYLRDKMVHNITKGHLLSYPRIFWYTGKALWGKRNGGKPS